MVIVLLCIVLLYIVLFAGVDSHSYAHAFSKASRGAGTDDIFDTGPSVEDRTEWSEGMRKEMSRFTAPSEMADARLSSEDRSMLVVLAAERVERMLDSLMVT